MNSTWQKNIKKSERNPTQEPAIEYDEILCSRLLKNAMQLPVPENFYQGLLLPDGFELPDNILLFFKDFPSGNKTNSRYSIIVPFDPMTYYCNGMPLSVAPGMAVIHHPYETNSVTISTGHCRRMHITFELRTPQCWIPNSPVAALSKDAWKQLRTIMKLFRKGETFQLSVAIAELGWKLCRHPLQCAQRNPSALVAGVKYWSDPGQISGERIKTIAARLGMSESNLRLRSRLETGLPVGKFLREKRFSVACHLLENSSRSISEIAKACGYDTVYSFSRAFKNTFGISPLAWKKTYCQTTREKTGVLPFQNLTKGTGHQTC